MPSDLLFKLVNAIHRPLFRISKGKIAGKGLGMPVLALTTTGRKSGPIADRDADLAPAARRFDRARRLRGTARTATPTGTSTCKPIRRSRWSSVAPPAR